MDIQKFVENFNGSEGQTNEQKKDKWSEIITPASSYLVLGDMNTGKSGLAYWLLERFSKEYNLTPTVVGIPKAKSTLLPDNFVFLDPPDECTGAENAIVFIDEADLQLPMDSHKLKQYVVNFLSLPFHRNQIFIMAFHFPRLVMGTYLPFFTAFLLKRPPYLLEFASKGQSKAVMGMMEKAEERFAEIPSPNDVVKYTYVVAPRLRWQGILENPLASFWSSEMRAIWPGMGITERQGEQPKGGDQLTISSLLQKPFLTPDQNPYIYTVAELRELCRKEGMPASGDKHTLVKRLFGFW